MYKRRALTVRSRGQIVRYEALRAIGELVSVALIDGNYFFAAGLLAAAVFVCVEAVLAVRPRDVEHDAIGSRGDRIAGIELRTCEVRVVVWSWHVEYLHIDRRVHAVGRLQQRDQPDS